MQQDGGKLHVPRRLLVDARHHLPRAEEGGALDTGDASGRGLPPGWKETKQGGEEAVGVFDDGAVHCARNDEEL